MSTATPLETRLCAGERGEVMAERRLKKGKGTYEGEVGEAGRGGLGR